MFTRVYVNVTVCVNVNNTATMMMMLMLMSMMKKFIVMANAIMAQGSVAQQGYTYHMGITQATREVGGKIHT